MTTKPFCIDPIAVNGPTHLDFVTRFGSVASGVLVWLSVVTASLEHIDAQTFPPLTNSLPEVKLELGPTNIWVSGIGEGFRASAQSFGLSAGATYGLAIFGSRQAHDLALGSLSYGHMLGKVLGQGHWYRGNAELRLELFSGAQFSPETQWFVGLTPHVRYNFATGTRWIPFADAGAGVTGTGIGPPDLSGNFEFNLQAGGGLHWFLRDNMAITLDARYVHWSCAGIHEPNLGLNGLTGMVGVTFFF